MSSTAYIFVHGGAGVHGVHNEKEIKRALRKACVQGLSVVKNASPLSSSSSPSSSANGQPCTMVLDDNPAEPKVRHENNMISLSMVAEAIAVLEDDGNLNAGYGSNLTMEGTVECDAGIMNGRDASYGSVCAVSGVKNPIHLAKSILEYSLLPSRFGRVPPLTLASNGAHAFAVQVASNLEATAHHSSYRKVQTVAPETLISPSASGQWRKWKGRWDSAAVVPPDDEEEGMKDRQDTVGAVAFHPTEGVAAGVSSGGLLLKWPGRIGEAGVYGAGCWANQFGIACSVSGTGEHIVRENLARKLCDGFDPEREDNDAHEILRLGLEGFWRSCVSLGEVEPAVGVVLVTCDRDERGSPGSPRLWCGFTTASMAIGYGSSDDERPKAVILRHPKARVKDEREGGMQIYITSIGLQGGCGT